MSRDTRKTLGLLASTVVACLIAAPPAVGQAAPAKDQTAEGKVDPQINAQFQKADVEAWIKRFESEDREVFARRSEIISALGLKPGMAVADIGAGTGLFTRLMAEKVGGEGKVYAVDVSAAFLKYIAEQSRRLGQKQVATVRGTQDTTNLPPGSVDLVFFCDVYHHLEDPDPVLASIRRALRPGGALVLVEFDRARAKKGSFVTKHVRADKDQFVREIERAGFTIDPSKPAVKLAENFFVRFRKNAPPASPAKPRAPRETGGSGS
jgi:ubiquinone/menaquinone biosynthesis C-methylase UbiE